MRILILSTIVIIVTLPSAARAACPNPNEPSGNSVEGTQVYNFDYKVMQYCDGTTWWSMKTGGVSILNSLSDTNIPAPAGNDVLTYDSATGKWVAGTPGIGAETDPQVNTLTGSKWCASNAGGTAINCTQNAPVGDNLGAGGSGDLITDNTIDSTEIQDNTLTANDLAVDSVGASEIAVNAVGSSEIAANAVGVSEIAANAVGGSEITNGSIVATTELSATGTKNSTTFLRGDNTWAAPSGGGGITAITTTSCSSSGGACTATCPATYFRTGCSIYTHPFTNHGVSLSGANACTEPDFIGTITAHCAK